jgi:predicted metal-dependent hydrolase
VTKAERIEAYVRSLGLPADSGHHPCYLAYFGCFNAGEYYEAHDVLEHLWLHSSDGFSSYYKGLIQFAGAFVHLKKQFLRPEHPTDGRRLAPASRLFKLALANLSPYPDSCLGLNLPAVRQLAQTHIATIEQSNFTQNPWTPNHLPRLAPEAHAS